jgi:hypothetical protein
MRSASRYGNFPASVRAFQQFVGQENSALLIALNRAGHGEMLIVEGQSIGRRRQVLLSL